MDSIFLFGEADRAAFLRLGMQSFGCAYICIWSYYPLPSKCLLFLDGFYQEESSQQSSSSSGSLATKLFDAYCGSLNYVDFGCLPGLAFKNNLPYMEVKLDNHQALAWSEVQKQFYQEARIKTVVFMGCPMGEIEMGFSSEPQVNLEKEIKSWFREDCARQTGPGGIPPTSSSSLPSLSIDDIGYSPSLFNIPTTSFITEPSDENLVGESLFQQDTLNPHLTQIHNIHQFPAILAHVLSSPSTSSSSQSTGPNLPPISHERGAFRSYRAGLSPDHRGRTRKQNLFRRAVSFFRSLDLRTRTEMQIRGNRNTATQLHHMIQERRRREKLNDSFQVLRTLLPQLQKKDKVSVLSRTTEYISSLNSQLKELRRRHSTLETQLSTPQREGVEQVGILADSSTEITANVETAHVPESTSEAKVVDLRVSLTSRLDSAVEVLKMLKQRRNLSLLSLKSGSWMVESAPVHGLVLRLKVEGDEFDESDFQEAVKRAIEDGPPL